MEKLLEMMMELRGRLADEQEADYMGKDYYRLDKLRIDCSNIVSDLIMDHKKGDIEWIFKIPIIE